MVGITAMAGIFNQVLDVAAKIKTTHPQTVICVGGPYASTLGKEILDFADIVYSILKNALYPL